MLCVSRFYLVKLPNAQPAHEMIFPAAAVLIEGETQVIFI